MFSPSLSLGALYWSALEQFSTEIAVVEGEKQISYAELKVAVERTAAIFSENGLTPGKRVGLAMGMSTDFVVTYLAAQVVGITVVELNPMLDNARLTAHAPVFRGTCSAPDQIVRMPAGMYACAADLTVVLTSTAVTVAAGETSTTVTVDGYIGQPVP